MGGFFAGILQPLAIFAKILNKSYLYSKISKALYFLKGKDKKINKSESIYKNLIKNLKHNKYKQQLLKDLDIVTLIKTIWKLKAGLSAVIKDNQSVLEDARNA